MIKIKNLNHMVLFVSDVERSVDFYSKVLGFVTREKIGDSAVFMHASDSKNHHDLGLIYAGDNAAPLTSGPRIGLYHSAWEVSTIDDLVEAKKDLERVGVLAGESEHGNSLSLYAKDPDGNEFEIFWMVPQKDWAKRPFGVHKLNWPKELKQYSRKRNS
ncbi:MAG: VOC family protein [Candidatus Saccharimonadales bacterium]